MALLQPPNAFIPLYSGPAYPPEVDELSRLFALAPEGGEKLETVLKKFGLERSWGVTIKHGYHTLDGHECRAVLFARDTRDRVFGVSLPGPTRSPAIYSDRPDPLGCERFARELIETLKVQFAAA